MPLLKFGFFIKITLVFLLMTAGQPAAVAQSLSEVQSLYDEGRYSEAIRRSGAMLKNVEALQATEIVILHRLTAIAFYNIGQQDSSKSHFLSLLSLRPDIRLDAGEVSPKIIEFFEQIRREAPRPPDDARTIAYTRYLIEKDLRRHAAWRSALLPGWGQFYKGQPKRAILLGGLFWAGLSGTIIARSREIDRRDSYAGATGGSNIRSAYDEYNRWFKTRQGLSYATALLWLLAVGDANFSDYRKPPISIDPGGQITLSLQVSF